MHMPGTPNDILELEAKIHHLSLAAHRGVDLRSSTPHISQTAEAPSHCIPPLLSLISGPYTNGELPHTNER